MFPGTYGQKITLQANYFKLETESVTDFSLYQYRVDFSPDEERTVVRKGLLRLHHPEIGPYIFDGTVMYSSEKLPSVKFSNLLNLNIRGINFLFILQIRIWESPFLK